MPSVKSGEATGDPTAAGLPSAPLRAAERILGVARKLFYLRGIRAIGVDEIVREAGVTKPSLYRSFVSKDELAASYLRSYEAEFWARFEAALAAHPGNPRAGLLEYFARVATRAGRPGLRGCGLSNAAVEYPEPEHPARLVSQANKRALRGRLQGLAAEMGAHDPEELADGLLLLFEGANITGQIFGERGPAGALAKAADRLIAASL